MAEYEINCVSFDNNHAISHVGFRGYNPEPVQNVVNWINTSTHNFYTYQDGRRAEVEARQHKTTRRWYLTTDPDDTRENNLDFLQEC